jgi:hypothetical protein
MRDNDKIYSDNPEINTMQKYSDVVFKLFCQIVNAKMIPHKNIKNRYLTDTNLHFEKFNVIAIIDTILYLFFQNVRIDMRSTF